MSSGNGWHSLTRGSSEVLPPDHSRLQINEYVSPQDSPLRLYYNILVKRRWTVIACLIIVLTITAIVSFRTTPLYRSSSRLVVNGQDSSLLDFKESGNQSQQYLDDRDLATYIKILQSHNLSLVVLRTLHLDQNPAFAPLPPGSADGLHGNADSERENTLAERLHAGLTVSLVPDTKIIQIDYTSPSAALSSEIANGYAHSFIEQNYATKYQSTMEAAEWLSTQLADLQLKVETSQAKLARYQKENEIVGIDDKQNIITERLTELNKELTSAQSERIQREANYRLNLTNTDKSESTGDAMLEKLREQEADLRTQFAQLTSQFGPAYPKVQQLKSQLDQLHEEIAKEQVTNTAHLRDQFLSAQRREDMLTKSFERQKQEANQLNAKTADYAMLKREAESNRQLYDNLLQKLKEAGLSAGLRSGNIRIYDPARAPKAPAEPNIPRNLSIAFVVGLSLGIGLAFSLEALDNTVRNSEEVQMISTLPVIGIVPLGKSSYKNAPRRAHSLKAPAAELPAANSTPVEIISQSRPRSEIAEAYRSLRTSILLSAAGKPPQVILVTSALPEEGKTTTSVNTAIVLAQRGARVLLVDADLRRPSIHKAMGLPSSLGLSGALTHPDESFENVIVPSPTVPNLYVIPAGPIPPYPAELLGSNAMRTFLEKAKSQFDHIIVDSTPVLSVTDAVVLSVEVDGVLVVIRSGQTTKRALRRIGEIFNQVNARVIGVVLNAVNLNEPDNYHYYYYGSKYSGQYYRSDEDEEKVNSASA